MTWMNQKGIIFGKRSQPQKGKFLILSNEVSTIGLEVENKMMMLDLREGKMERY